MEIVGSIWEMTALPGGKTRIALKLTVPKHDSIGMPRWVIDYVQRYSLRDSVTNFLKGAHRPPHPPRGTKPHPDSPDPRRAVLPPQPALPPRDALQPPSG